MTYSICNRILYRGFHPCKDGKQTIIKPNGRIVKGYWLTGALVEIPMSGVPGDNDKPLPLLCLTKPGTPVRKVTEQTVCASTLSLYSGYMLDDDWGDLPQKTKEQWLKQGKKDHEWEGVPIFEGDILKVKRAKALFVVIYNQEGFRLEQVGESSVRPITDLENPEQFKLVGSMWAPPKEGISAEVMRVFHEQRNAESVGQGTELLSVEYR